MNLKTDKYIIVEIIPTYSTKDKGYIAQLSALKIDNLKLLDRFDYRIKDNLIENDDLKRFIQYDKKSFTYVDNKYFIIEKFKQWAEDYPLLILEEIENTKELVYPYLNMEYSLDVFEKILDKYKLEPSNHLVDLIYEAIIFETNK